MCQWSGFTKTLSHEAPYYVINFDDSSNETDTITSGTGKERKTLIALRKDIEDYETLAPSNPKGLIPAIQEIEKLLDYDALDLEFYIGAKGEVHILQVRPLTSNKHQVQSDNLIFDAISSSKQHLEICKKLILSQLENQRFLVLCPTGILQRLSS